MPSRPRVRKARGVTRRRRTKKVKPRSTDASETASSVADTDVGGEVVAEKSSNGDQPASSISGASAELLKSITFKVLSHTSAGVTAILGVLVLIVMLYSFGVLPLPVGAWIGKRVAAWWERKHPDAEKNKEAIPLALKQMAHNFTSVEPHTKTVREMNDDELAPFRGQ